MTRLHNAIRLIHEFSITGPIARQPLLMADQACNCWFFFISNKFNGLIFNMEYDIYTTKIDGVVCPPNISDTVAVRTMKLAHRPRIASTTITLISKPILLSIL